MSARASRDEPAVSFDEQQRRDRAAELEAELLWLTQQRRRDNLIMFTGIVLSLAIAIPMMAMSAHVVGEAEGRAWLYSGLVLGDLGVFGTVIWGLNRSVERGDARW